MIRINAGRLYECILADVGEIIFLSTYILFIKVKFDSGFVRIGEHKVLRLMTLSRTAWFCTVIIYSNKKRCLKLSSIQQPL
jgi:hypothetical protein